MYCQKCGTENPDGANICVKCSWVLTGTAAAPAAGAKTEGLATASLVLGIASIVTCFITAIPAFICGIIALVKIGKSNGSRKGTGMAITGMALPVVLVPFVAMLLAILMPALSKAKSTAERVVCATNLKGLGLAVMMYANDYDDKFPTADKWCDLLIENVDVDEKSLQCPTAPPGSYCYAFNRNLAGLQTSQVSGDVVMIFETEPAGRNACGGPELLKPDAHNGSLSGGCNILFADGHVAFYRADGISDLKWTPE